VNEDVDWIGMVGTVERKLLRRISRNKSMRSTSTNLFANVEQRESHDGGSGCQQVLVLI
jgi:hypothetical protein